MVATQIEWFCNVRIEWFCNVIRMVWQHRVYGFAIQMVLQQEYKVQSTICIQFACTLAVLTPSYIHGTQEQR